MDATTKPSCANCGHPAFKKCAGCFRDHDGDDTSAVAHYCDRACQKLHWNTHKAECKNAADRELLYRSGAMLRDVFYSFREHAFDMSFTDVECTTDGKIHLYEGIYAPQQILVDFPNHLALTDDVTKAVLTYNACGEPLVYLHSLSRKLLEGLCFEVVEVFFNVKRSKKRMVHHYLTSWNKDGITGLRHERIDETNYHHQALVVTTKWGGRYIIDIAGAQYGQFEAVVPLKKYCREYVANFEKVDQFGDHCQERQRAIYDAARTGNYSVGSGRCTYNEVMFAGAKMGTVLAQAIEQWETSSATTVADVLKLALSERESQVENFQRFIADKLKAAQLATHGLQHWEIMVPPHDFDRKTDDQHIIQNRAQLVELNKNCGNGSDGDLWTFT